MIFGEKMCNMIQVPQQVKLNNSSENNNSSSGVVNNSVEPFSFSALHFLRAYNRLLSPTELSHSYNLANQQTVENFPNVQPLPPLETILPVPKNQILNVTTPASPSESSSNSNVSIASSIYNKSKTSSEGALTILMPPVLSNQNTSNANILPGINPNGLLLSPPLNKNFLCGSFVRRQRGEKRPIPEEQKDEKYFERRKRNNEAAKKSRDARKMREDRIALRAALLEQENSILRAQTLALREEVCTLRQILCTTASTTARPTSQLTSI